MRCGINRFCMAAFFGRRFVFQKRFQVLSQVARVKFRRSFVQFVNMHQYFQAQRVLVRPMLVDRCFADARRCRNRVHTGCIDSAFRKQFRRRFQNLMVRALAESSSHLPKSQSSKSATPPGR